MAKHQKHITQALTTYLSSAVQKRRQKYWHKNQQQLPKALKLSFLRGETILRQRLFDYFENKGFDDNFSYLVYQKIILDSNVINDFTRQIKLQQAAEEHLKRGTDNQAYQLYCILIDHLAQNAEQHLLQQATTDLIHYYLPSFFPKAKNLKPSLQSLKKQLRKELNTLWKCQTTIKESFTTTPQSAEIKIIAHIQSHHPTELICQTAKRLRSARFQAYHKLLQQIQNQQLKLTPTQKKYWKKPPPTQTICYNAAVIKRKYHENAVKTTFTHLLPTRETKVMHKVWIARGSLLPLSNCWRNSLPQTGRHRKAKHNGIDGQNDKLTGRHILAVTENGSESSFSVVGTDIKKQWKKSDNL